jgi:hypothetical protein
MELAKKTSKCRLPGGDGTSWENGGDQSKEKKKWGVTGMKKRKKNTAFFFFFGIAGDHGHHRSPPNPSLPSGHHFSGET